MNNFVFVFFCATLLGGASAVLNCSCVAFRLDDIQDYFTVSDFTPEMK
jgi:hypothetical protein